MNPLLAKFDTPFDSIPFDKIKNVHFLPAIQEAIKQAKEEIRILKENKAEPNFNNTIEALERSGELVNTIAELFFNLNSAETNDEIQALAREISPLLDDFGNDIILDEQLFGKIKTVYNQKETYTLNTEETTLLEKTYKDFIRNGANLNLLEKEELREITKQKSQLALEFGEHILEETNKYQLVLTNKDDLGGLPNSAIELAEETAKEKGIEGWVINLDYPSYMPFMTYAQNRELRKELFLAYNSKGFKNDNLDNQEIIKQIAKLRYEKAVLLGYKSHADFVLEERMASNPATVIEFLNKLLEKAKPFALKEIEELATFAKETDGIENLERWDSAYYSEKLKLAKYNLDEEELKPYFKLENVVKGVFEVAKKLYGLVYTKNLSLSVYHPDVEAYEVTDLNGKHIGIFYADFFPRPGKRSGAWMTSFRSQKKMNGQDYRPHVSIVCNFSKPTESKPSLLTFNEVTTLFHEFGHSLHGILANGTYSSLSGTNVYWDFVELPSQLLENWAFEKECLDLFAHHYETCELIPSTFIDKIKATQNYQAGMATLRQLGFALLDMAWHTNNPIKIKDVASFENEVLSLTNLLPTISGTNSSCAFSHIFQGGYSAGYYSYKWAEVLDADAFEFFLENGIFNKDIANKFQTNVLSSGGSEHPMTLYKRFRGQEPQIEALIRKYGFNTKPV